MKAKNGDIIDFLAINWDNPNWEFDHPTVILQPAIRYYEDLSSCEEAIEEMTEEFVCDKDVENDDVSNESFKISTLKNVCKKRLSGKDVWKTKIREVVKQKIEFYNNEDNELDYKILETIKA